MEEKTTRVCNKCNQELELETGFYTARTKKGVIYDRQCKKCKNKKRMESYQPKATGLDAVDSETREKIIKMLDEGLIPISKIASTTGISRSRIIYFRDTRNTVGSVE